MRRDACSTDPKDGRSPARSAAETARSASSAPYAQLDIFPRTAIFDDDGPAPPEFWSDDGPLQNAPAKSPVRVPCSALAVPGRERAFASARLRASQARRHTRAHLPMGAGIGVAASVIRRHRAPAENGEQHREHASHVISTEAGSRYRAASDPVLTPVPRGASLALGTHDLGRAAAQQSGDDGALAVWPHGYHIHGLGGFVVHRLVNQGAFGQVSQKFQRGIPILRAVSLTGLRGSPWRRSRASQLRAQARSMATRHPPRSRECQVRGSRND